MFRKLLIILILVLLLDLVYLNLTSKIYNETIKKIQNKSIKINFIGAILSYVCVILIIYIFILPKIKSSNLSILKGSLLYGGGLGFLVYGVYNFTNLAIFEKYDLFTVIMDTLWGTFLFTIVSYLTLSIDK